MLKLIAPGKRKGNRFIIARGRIGGRLYEFSTETTDPDAAERIAAEFTAERLKRRPDPETVKFRTFKDAADAYIAFRSPDIEQVRRINRLIATIGQKPLETITQIDLVTAADNLYPKHKASSRNRLVITPCSAILHYASLAGWCPYLRIKRFKEARPETRALRPPAAKALIRAATGTERALLVFLFYQGMRISDAIKVDWADVDLPKGQFKARIGKTDQWRWKALHPDARAALAGLDHRTGAVFPYQNRWGVYRALKPAIAKTGVNFTPHMARHSLGTWLAGAGVSLKTRMDMLDHADPKSTIRYDMSQIPEQRAALAGLGRLRGKKRGEAV